MKRSELAALSLNPSRGIGLLEIMVCVLLMALIIPSLLDLQGGSERSLIKAGEFMVASAILQNTSSAYKLKPFRDIESTAYSFDESGKQITAGKPAFQVKVDAEPVIMPNQWTMYKRMSLEVLKPGTFFGTTLLKTVFIRVSSTPGE